MGVQWPNSPGLKTPRFDFVSATHSHHRACSVVNEQRQCRLWAGTWPEHTQAIHPPKAGSPAYPLVVSLGRAIRSAIRNPPRRSVGLAAHCLCYL